MIKIHDLYKSYGPLQVINGLSLDIIEGETIVILGRSGEGKSVLLRQIIGIEEPDSGFVEVDGINISHLTAREREVHTKEMGMLFQGAALFDSMDVFENTAFYLRQHESQLAEKEIADRVQDALEKVGLQGTDKKMPSDLSGGMRKRAALARLIVYRPKIILYDEPTTGLDPITAMQINKLIIKTQDTLSATSVVVTHDIKSALEVGDRLAFLYKGKILHVAKKGEFFKIEDPVLHSFFEMAALKESAFG